MFATLLREPLVWVQKSSTQPITLEPTLIRVGAKSLLETWWDPGVSLQSSTDFCPFFIASSIAASIAAVRVATSSWSRFTSISNFLLP